MEREVDCTDTLFPYQQHPHSSLTGSPPHTQLTLVITLNGARSDCPGGVRVTLMTKRSLGGGDRCGLGEELPDDGRDLGRGGEGDFPLPLGDFDPFPVEHCLEWDSKAENL